MLPGRCCMPGPHYESECHSPEDAEQAALLGEMEELLRFDGLCAETRALITAAIDAHRRGPASDPTPPPSPAPCAEPLPG